MTRRVSWSLVIATAIGPTATTATAASAAPPVRERGSFVGVGKPIQLIGPDGGVRLLDAGWVEFDPDGNASDVRGPHPSLDADLRDYYCPR
jgi:hypothetical protein